jgi:hypothetical protein
MELQDDASSAAGGAGQRRGIRMGDRGNLSDDRAMSLRAKSFVDLLDPETGDLPRC